jgi:formamidopyrimidine-DNA glycosylase
MQRELKNNSKEVKKLSEEQQYPSVGEQAKNIVNLVQDAISDVLKGNQLFVTEEEQTRRMEICKACDQYSQEDERCRKCGCFLKQKTSLTSSKCPLNKWNPNQSTSWF